MKKARSTGTLALLLALTLILGCVTGGTLAWLTAKTSDVVNTFTYGDINITLTEEAGKNNDYTFHAIPGATITKDPKVTVVDGSEDCYLFVKITESANFTNGYISYEIADGWTEVEDGVYCRVVKSTDTTKSFSVLKGDQVTISTDLTKDKVAALNETNPTLTFTAYAIQESAAATAAAAWALIPKN